MCASFTHTTFIAHCRDQVTPMKPNPWWINRFEPHFLPHFLIYILNCLLRECMSVPHEILGTEHCTTTLLLPPLRALPAELHKVFDNFLTWTRSSQHSICHPSWIQCTKPRLCLSHVSHPTASNTAYTSVSKNGSAYKGAVCRETFPMVTASQNQW